MSDQDAVVAALTALAAGDTGSARRTLAAAAGTSLLAGALATYLGGDRGGPVYDQPAAFTAFIRGGGNVPLYEAVGAALAGLYDEHRPAAVLDVGCGDGEALLPALAHTRCRPARLDLVEPSPVLLAAAVRRLGSQVHGGAGPSVATSPTTAQDLAAHLGPEHTWDLAQSSFALHTLPPQERSSVLSVLRAHVGLLAVVEFDVPDVAPGSPPHLHLLAGSYERGLAEYGDDRDLVAQGFLMPVLVGQLAPGAVRATWEQPAERWRHQLEAAGYTEVATRRVADFWSAPVFLLTARGGVPGASPARPVPPRPPTAATAPTATSRSGCARRSPPAAPGSPPCSASTTRSWPPRRRPTPTTSTTPRAPPPPSSAPSWRRSCGRRAAPAPSSWKRWRGSGTGRTGRAGAAGPRSARGGWWRVPPR